MTLARIALRALAASVVVVSGTQARAVELPPTCRAEHGAPDDVTPLAELHQRLETLIETDPTSAVRLMCSTIPRVERESGQDSVELAWWVGSLATPLIAFMDKHAEAAPLLDFAQSILERRLGPDAPALGDIHVARAWSAFRQGRLTDARAAWESALRIRERSPGPRKIELQKILVGLAQVKLALRDFPGARAALDRAHAILAENGETASEAAAAIENAYTNLSLREEDYATARRHAEAQIDIELKLQGGAMQLVPAYVLLGQILEHLDEFEESEKNLREAVRLAESNEGPLQRHQLAALTQLGSLLNDRGRPREALDFGRRALALGEATLGAEAPRLVRVLQNLAEACRAVGQLPEALHLYERAAAIVAKDSTDVERQILVAHHRGLGRLELILGEPSIAASELNAALDAAGAEPTLSTERAFVLLTLAEAPSASGAVRRRPQLEEALSLFRARLPDSHPAVLRTIDALCALESETTPETAPHCDDLTRRLDAAREVEPSLAQAAWEQLSRLAERRRDADRAYSLAIRSLAAAGSLGAPGPLWRASFRLADVLHDRGDRTLAIFFGKQAVQQIERLRSYFVGEDRRLDRGFLSDKAAAYRALADWLMEAGRVDEGLSVLRRLKGQELYEFVLRDAASAPEGRELELTAHEATLLDAYTNSVDTNAAAGDQIDRLGRLQEVGRISATERLRLDELLTGQRQAEASRAERIRVFLTSAAPVPGSGAGGEKASRPALAARQFELDLSRFGPDSALAYYILTEDHLRVLVATRGGQFEHTTPLDAAALRRDIGHFLDAISRREDVGAASRALYEIVARPVDEAAHRVRAKRLVLWLDGALRYLPFAALSDGRQSLIDKYEIESYGAAGAAPLTADAGGGAALTVRGFGVTTAVGGRPRLPAVADELCSIVRGPITGLASAGKACPTPATGNGALRGEGFADAAFTAPRIRDLLTGPRDFSVLHLSTHFALRPGNALRSFLVLGDGTRLTLDALGGLDFSGIELLTLSACETALGGAVADDGREVDALSAVALRRGARRVVASLWQVEDASTATLMETMYRALASGRAGVAGSLRQAQLAVRSHGRDGRRPYEHPYYWAGFVLAGDRP